MLRDAMAEDLLSQQTEKVVPVVSKRNQQPGRLSGSERTALRNLMTLVDATGATDEEFMKEGRALLAKVRKRALGDRAEVAPEDGS